MPTELEKFLGKYKELEEVIRQEATDTTVLQYEESLSASDSDRLKICRQIRNYVQHHDDGKMFLAATEKMNKFLTDLITKEKAKEEQAVNKLYKLSPVTLDFKLSEITEKFAKTKRDWLPVVDENSCYIGCISLLQLVCLLCNTKNTVKLKTAVQLKELSKKSPIKVTKETSLKGLENEDLIVIGKDGKYAGIVKW